MTLAGLDPAGPLFEGQDWATGLNPSCADFVDVIHTHGAPGIIINLGTMKVLGDADFYPSGGGSQPGCIQNPMDIDDIMLGEDDNTLLGQFLRPAITGNIYIR